MTEEEIRKLPTSKLLIMAFDEEAQRIVYDAIEAALKAQGVTDASATDAGFEAVMALVEAEINRRIPVPT